jgi:PPPDE putative peptidase domain
MFPYEVLNLGRTTINQSQFEQWCQEMMRNGTYSAAAYDLLQRNCNNFCHDAVTQCFGFSPTVFPEWIIDVPRRFLSSPMGQVVRPMLQNMQISSAEGAEPLTEAPFANYNSSASSNSRAATAVVVIPPNNPWASITTSNPSAATTKNDTPNTTNTKQMPLSDGESRGTPLLDSFTKPLLSSDTKTVDLCIGKIAAYNAAAKTVLEDAAPILRCTDPSKTLYALDAEQVHLVLHMALASDEAPELRTFVLMLLRLVVLRYRPTNLEATMAIVTHDMCMSWVKEELRNNNNHVTKLNSPAARTMAWLTASNAIGALTIVPTSKERPERLDDWVELAIAEVSNVCQRDEVRQAACALLYNAALILNNRNVCEDELPDTTVSMLCAALEGIVEERDATTRLRRLMVVGRILKPLHKSCSSIDQTAKSLVVDLGFTDAFRVLSFPSVSTGDAGKCQRLASEMLQLLQD